MRFIRKCFQDLSFSNRWSNWLVQCVTILSFRVIVNGKTWYSFNPERGIRQVDSLSPYIFIVYAEYLGWYIHFVSNQRKSGIDIKLNKDSLTIPYLMFVDIRIISCRASRRAAQNIKHILVNYCTYFGKLLTYFGNRFIFW